MERKKQPVVFLLNSLFCQSNSLLSPETGNSYKALELKIESAQIGGKQENNREF
jgi:hypothetical protein